LLEEAVEVLTTPAVEVLEVIEHLFQEEQK
jgi:hypothetical protein